MLRVNTGNWSSGLANPVSVANTQPGDLPRLHILVPEWDIVRAYRAGIMDWEVYTESYSRKLARRLSEKGLPGNGPRMRIVYVLTSAAVKLGVDEITLCCWEAEDNPHCHRKLIYHWLPEVMKGVCR
jgi:hypothetical protein